MDICGFPSSFEDGFRYWVTVQYSNGFRRTELAKWDWYNSYFKCLNGREISQEVMAYKYYSEPEPYDLERSDNHDGIKAGKKTLAKELSHIIDAHLTVSLKEGKENNKVSHRALEKFKGLLDERSYEE